MGIFDTVVVGVDGSSAAADALRWAESVTSTNQSIHTITADERAGDPAAVLLRAAAEVDADAIVIGRHSSHWPLGSIGGVTRRLLQQSTIPLVIGRQDPHVSSAGDTADHPIVAGVGYGHPAEAAAVWAAALAEQMQNSVRLLHIIGHRPMYPADSPSDTLGSYLGSDVLMQWVKEDLDHLRATVTSTYPDVPVEVAIELGFVARSLVAAGKTAPIVVLGRRSNQGVLRGFVSPRIQQVVARAGSIIAVVPSCKTDL